jgi:ribosomal protein S18 acetylase RimI-like enzyme
MTDRPAASTAVPMRVRLRRPTEADYPTIVAVVDEWFGGRRTHDRLPRFWFRHFRGTSWVAEDDVRALVGFLVGFLSPDDPTVAVIHLAAVDPNHRRQRIGATLYDHFAADAAGRGATALETVVWPGDPIAIAFHRATGFEPVFGPETRNLYGSPAFADYDFEREDRILFERPLKPPPSGGAMRG